MISNAGHLYLTATTPTTTLDDKHHNRTSPHEPRGMGHAISCVFYCGSMGPWGGPYPMQGHAEWTPSMHRETARANTNRPVTTRACKLLVTIYLLSSPPPVSPLFHRRKSSHRIVLVSFHTPPTQMQSSPNTRTLFPEKYQYLLQHLVPLGPFTPLLHLHFSAVHRILIPCTRSRSF